MRKISNNIFDKETVITMGVIFICILLYVLFPTKNTFQQIISTLAFFLVIPFLYVKIILKREVSDYGIQKGNWSKGLLWSAISILTAMLVFYFFVRYANFLKNYNLPRTVKENFTFFLGYEILLTGFFVAAYEIFFRGFLMRSIWKKIGYLAIIFQSVAFFLLFYLSSSFSWSVVPYLIFAPFSGLIVSRSRSILYSFASNFLFIVIVDSVFIKLAK
ncbi:MAG: hypothetical protein Q7S18_03660 [bacterium]|nr:hypothetical protein [bacterium]